MRTRASWRHLRTAIRQHRLGLALALPCNHLDSVGIYWLDENRARHASELSEIYGGLARGKITSPDIPAYRFQEPVSAALEGFLPQMEHWEWQEP